jgi:hypothetical protein
MDRRCKNCNKFLPRDITARRRFCDDKCRVAYHRTSSAQALYGSGIQAISSLGKVAAGEKQLATETLKLLRKAIDDQLRVLGDVQTIDKYEMLAGNHSVTLVRCKDCGQRRYTVPKQGEKCDFCKGENWSVQS